MLALIGEVDIYSTFPGNNGNLNSKEEALQLLAVTTDFFMEYGTTKIYCRYSELSPAFLLRAVVDYDVELTVRDEVLFDIVRPLWFMLPSNWVHSGNVLGTMHLDLINRKGKISHGRYTNGWIDRLTFRETKIEFTF